jgi:GcrA cell cycle regulator
MNNNAVPSIWTDELIAELTKLWAEGYSSSIVGEKLGISRNAVVGKINRLDLPTPLVPKTTRIRNTGAGERERAPRKARPRKQAIKHYQSIRAVRVNGNSDSMRLIMSPATNLPVLRCVGIDPLLISLEDIRNGECRYPYGDGPFLFCGHPATDGSSYCMPHKWLCSEPPRAPIHRFARAMA